MKKKYSESGRLGDLLDGTNTHILDFLLNLSRCPVQLFGNLALLVTRQQVVLLAHITIYRAL